MSNYFTISTNNQLIPFELSSCTIKGKGKSGKSNAAEQFLASLLNLPVRGIKEITGEKYRELNSKCQGGILSEKKCSY